jgi:drug/metabolite transporter (DMT)-like permease
VALLLATLSSAFLGAADFLSGLGGRRLDRPGASMAMAWWASIVGAVVATAFVALFPPDDLGLDDIGWSVAAGLAVTVVRPLLYLGMTTGPIAVFAPTFSLVALVVPAVFGPLIGHDLGSVELVGVVVALPAVVLVSSGDRLPTLTELHGSAAVRLGVTVGALLGVMSLCLALVDEGADTAPAAISQGVAAVLIPAMLLVGVPLARPDAAVLRWGSLVGLIDIVAVLATVVAYQRGAVAVVSAVLGLAPLISILLARTVLGEEIRPLQIAGGGLGVVALACFTVGA